MNAQKRSTSILLLGLFLLALPTAPASSVDDPASFLSTTLHDASLSITGHHVVALDLWLDNKLKASTTQEYSATNGKIDLNGLTAVVRTPAIDLVNRTLTTVLSLDGTELLRVSLIPTERTPQETQFVIIHQKQAYPSPLHLVGDNALSVRHGYSQDVITVAFRPTADAPRDAQIQLVATDSNNTILYQDTQTGKFTTAGNIVADFELLHLPPVLTWEAQLVLGDKDAAVLGKQINFADQSGTNGYYQNLGGAYTSAAGSHHAVEDHAEIYPVSSQVLSARGLGSRDKLPATPYGGAEGSTYQDLIPDLPQESCTDCEAITQRGSEGQLESSPVVPSYLSKYVIYGLLGCIGVLLAVLLIARSRVTRRT